MAFFQASSPVLADGGPRARKPDLFPTQSVIQPVTPRGVLLRVSRQEMYP
jgi:hypothetical protein